MAGQVISPSIPGDVNGVPAETALEILANGLTADDKATFRQRLEIVPGGAVDPTVIAAAVNTAVPPAVASALPGATGGIVTALADQPTSIAAGEALTYMPPPGVSTPTKSRNARQFYNFRKTFVQIGDYGGGFQDDMIEAARQRKECRGDNTASLVITTTLEVPQNIRLDGLNMRVLDNTSAPFNGVAAGDGPLMRLGASQGGGGSADYGYVRNILLDPGLVSETLANGNVVQRPRLNRNVDGLSLGSATVSGVYIRQTKLENIIINGVRKALLVPGDNVFIITMKGVLVLSAWQAGWEFSGAVNSGEKMTWEDCTISGVRNKIGNGEPGKAVVITSTGVDPRINMGNTSSDYCDILGEVRRGQLIWRKDCWGENSIDLPMFLMYRTGGKQPSSLDIDGKIVTQGPIGLDRDWTGRGGESPGGRPCLVAVYGNGNNLEVGGDLGNYSLNRNTEIYQMMDGGTLGRFIDRSTTDAGYARMDANGAIDNTTSPMGIGQPFLTSRDRNNFYLGTTAANLTGGFTSFSGLGTSTERYLPRGGALSSLRAFASGTAVSGLAGQQETVKVGDRVQNEIWVHIKSITQGYIALREQFLAEDIAQGVTPTLATPASWDSQYGATTGGFIGRLTTVSPESSNTATITIPDAAFPTRGLFTPGAMVQGTFAVGQELSGLNGAGITTGRCWILADNGTTVGGVQTYNVYIEQGTAVPAQTIIGYTKIVSKRPVPNGAKLVRSGAFVSNFIGEAFISGLNRAVQRA